MSLTLALIALTTAAPAVTEDEITVIGRRLAAISVMVGRDAKGRYTCDLSASTGNARLDARLCKTASTCVRKGATSQDAVRTCIDARKPVLLEQVRKELGQSAAGVFPSFLRGFAASREPDFLFPDARGRKKEVGLTRSREDAKGARV